MEFLFFPFAREKKRRPSKKEVFLKKSLRDAQYSLENAYTGLQNTNEPDLIDRYIFELNAAYLRYQVILRDMKKLTHASLESSSLEETISSTNRDTVTSLLNRSFK